VRQALERFFLVRERGSTLRTEVLGGATVFVTMAYIIVVNPAILKAAGIPPGPSTVATILAAVFGCLLMGLYANRPLAVAPYMGENAFIAFSLTAMTIQGAPITWQQRLGTVFVSGVAFLILTLLGLRRWLAEAISPSMKHSFAVGIGLFLFLVGVHETGIIRNGLAGLPVEAVPVVETVLPVPDEDLPVDLARTVGLLGTPLGQGALPAAAAMCPARTSRIVGVPEVPPVQIGNWRDTRVMLAILGFVLITTLLCWNVRGGVILGIILIAVLGYFLNLSPAPQGVVGTPWSEEHDLGQIAFQLDIPGVLRPAFFPILLTLFLISFLDTLGTLVAVGSAGHLLDEKGNFPEMEKPMLVDSLSCIFSSLVGTSTSGAFIESTTGVREGARTGLAAVVTGLLFAAALFFLPLVQPLQDLRYAYGPALMAVGVLMIGAVVNIDFQDFSETVPALTTITMMLFTFNIANGLTAGLALYPLFKVLTGRWRDLRVGTVALGALCAVYFVVGVPH
jgi:AGZA family xanthine/uracil permease-like MFS transporter